MPYLLVLALFVAGVMRAPLERSQALLLGFAAYYTLLHVATHGFARYRLPLMPLLFIYAGFAWERPAQPRDPSRAAAPWSARCSGSCSGPRC